LSSGSLDNSPDKTYAPKEEEKPVKKSWWKRVLGRK